MYTLESGDKNNSRYKSIILSRPDKADQFRRQFELGNFSIRDIKTYILNSYLLDSDSNSYFDNYCLILTMADEISEPLSYLEAMIYWFALQVNTSSARGKSRGKINSEYLAYKIGTACNWDYREYAGNLQDDFITEYVSIPVKFECLLNPITFKLPICKVSKGFFKQKEVGFILKPTMEAPGYFLVDNDASGLVEYKISKTLYANLFIDAQCHNGSYLFNDNNKSYLASMINRYDSNLIYEILYSQNIYSVYNFEISDQYWLDDSFLLNISTREIPEVREEDRDNIVWQEVRPYHYRLICYHKPYIVSIIGNTCYIMTEI